MPFDWFSGLHLVVIITLAVLGSIGWTLKRLIEAIIDAAGPDIWSLLRDEIHRRRKSDR